MGPKKNQEQPPPKAMSMRLQMKQIQEDVGNTPSAKGKRKITTDSDDEIDESPKVTRRSTRNSAPAVLSKEESDASDIEHVKPQRKKKAKASEISNSTSERSSEETMESAKVLGSKDISVESSESPLLIPNTNNVSTSGKNGGNSKPPLVNNIQNTVANEKQSENSKSSPLIPASASTNSLTGLATSTPSSSAPRRIGKKAAVETVQVSGSATDSDLEPPSKWIPRLERLVEDNEVLMLTSLEESHLHYESIIDEGRPSNAVHTAAQGLWGSYLYKQNELLRDNCGCPPLVDVSPFQESMIEHQLLNRWLSKDPTAPSTVVKAPSSASLSDRAAEPSKVDEAPAMPPPTGKRRGRGKASSSPVTVQDTASAEQQHDPYAVYAINEHGQLCIEPEPTDLTMILASSLALQDTELSVAMRDMVPAEWRKRFTPEQALRYWGLRYDKNILNEVDAHTFSNQRLIQEQQRLKELHEREERLRREKEELRIRREKEEEERKRLEEARRKAQEEKRQLEEEMIRKAQEEKRALQLERERMVRERLQQSDQQPKADPPRNYLGTVTVQISSKATPSKQAALKGGAVKESPTDKNSSSGRVVMLEASPVSKDKKSSQKVTQQGTQQELPKPQYGGYSSRSNNASSESNRPVDARGDDSRHHDDHRRKEGDGKDSRHRRRSESPRDGDRKGHYISSHHHHHRSAEGDDSSGTRQHHSAMNDSRRPQDNHSREPHQHARHRERSRDRADGQESRPPPSSSYGDNSRDYPVWQGQQAGSYQTGWQGQQQSQHSQQQHYGKQHSGYGPPAYYGGSSGQQHFPPYPHQGGHPHSQSHGNFSDDKGRRSRSRDRRDFSRSDSNRGGLSRDFQR